MVSGFLDSADKAGASTRMKNEPMDMYSLNLIGHCLAVASDDILQIIFRGWMSVMILIPATRPDLVAWLCRFLTTLQLHWWILFVLCLIGHCLAVASDDILPIIFRGWLPVMILYQLLDLIWWPDSVDSWPRYSCTDEFVCVVSDWTLSCCGQWWYLTNHLSGLNACDDPYTSY